MVVRRAAVVLAVAATLLLVGCGALGGQGTTQPAPTTQTTAPPGVDDGELQDLGALLAAHNETMAANGFVVEDTFYTPNGSTWRSTAQFRQFAVNHSDPGETDVWGNGTAMVSRYVSDDGETVYDLERPYEFRFGPSRADLTRRDNLRLVLGVAAFERNGTADCAAGGCVVLEPTGPNESARAAVSNLSGQVVVAPSGVIHRLSMQYDGTGGEPYSVQYRLVELGTESVERPAWVDEWTERDGS